MFWGYILRRIPTYAYNIFENMSIIMTNSNATSNYNTAKILSGTIVSKNWTILNLTDLHRSGDLVVMN